jgi:DNA-binding LytR/AlgR family response regulator
MKILIVEDEPITAVYLQNTLKEIDPEVKIIRIIDTVKAAIDWLKSQPAPDLIFMDIQLADGLSFDIFEEVSVESPVVFCTAYDEYAVKAFQTNGIDYVLKPFDRVSIERALEKSKRLQAHYAQNQVNIQQNYHDTFTALNKKAKTSVLVPFQDKYLPLAMQDIAAFYLIGGATYLRTFQQEEYYYPHSLEDIEHTLDQQLFYRLNRQFIVNHKAIKHVEHDSARKLLVIPCLKMPEQLKVSKEKAGAFLKWLEER